MIVAVLTNLLPKAIIHLLFRSFEAREDFLAQILELRKNYPKKPLAFVLYGANFVEFLAIRLFILDRFGPEMELRMATRLWGIYVESPGTLVRRFLAWFHLAPKPKSRIRLCSDELSAGRPILLNLEIHERRKAFQTPLGEMELSYLATQHPELLVVPTVFVWRRKRRLEEDANQDLSHRLWKNFVAPFVSPWQFLLGDPYQPTELRKILIMLRQYGRSTLRLCAPIGVNDMAAKSLRRKVLVEIQQEKRVILGPIYRSTRLIGETILRSPSFQRLVRELSAEEGTTELSIFKKSVKIFNEIAARFSYFTIEYMGWFLHYLFRTIFEDVTVEESDFDKLRLAAREGPLLYIPCHKSYIDFLVLSYILHRKQILPPHIAGGINMNFWPIGGVFRSSGAFFIRRSFRGNVLYAEILKRYIAELLASRVSVEFFIEGGRSRNGKLAPPKYGLLKMIVDSHYEGHIPEKVRVVPVSISYDRVTEERSHKRELEGGEKVQESALGVVKSGKVLFKKFGHVHVRFADPMPLESALERFVGEESASLETRRLGIQKLAFEVCHQINGVTPVTSFGLVCAALMARPGAALSRVEMERLLGLLSKDLVILGAQMTPELKSDFMGACRKALSQLLADGLIREYKTPQDARGIKIADKQKIAALYYKNSVIHALMLPAIRGLANDKNEALLELRSFLQFEFFFPEKDEFLKRVLATPTGPAYDFYAFMLDDVLENIALGLSGLIQMSGLWLETKEWKSRLMKFGQAAAEESQVFRTESVNTQSFSAFVEMAVNRNWITSRPHQAALFCPCPVPQLQAALARVRSFRPSAEAWESVRAKYLNDPKGAAAHNLILTHDDPPVSR